MMKIDIACLISAALFVVGNILGLTWRQIFRNRSEGTFQDFLELEPETLQGQWVSRKEYRSMEIAYGLISALAWLSFMIPVVRVAWLNSDRGQRQMGVHITVLVFAVGGSMTELTARLLHVGSMNAMEWLADSFNLSDWLLDGTDDNIGWRVLEIAYITTRGMLLWVDAVEWLLMAGILILFCHAVYRQAPDARVLDMQWARFGAFVAATCIADFAAEVLRFEDWRTFSMVSMIISYLNRLVFLPLWLLWLGHQLPLAVDEREPIDSSDFVGAATATDKASRSSSPRRDPSETDYSDSHY